MSSQTASVADEDDPVVASFDIILKPAFEADRSLYILQYPNRATDNPERLRNPDIETMRIKPHTGMVEVDVPLNYNANYDKKKGIAWGTALKKSMDGKGLSGSLGLAGGFGVNSAPGRRGRPAAGANLATDGSDHAAWAEALRTNNVLSTQTLGGMNVVESNARYAVAVFQGGSLHLTPAENLVHLRPTLHHLDAMAEQERASRPAPPGPGPGGKDAGGAKAIHMTIKSAMGEDEVIETMKDRLKAVQQEKWKRFEYVHDESGAAWEAYNDALLAEAPGDSATVSDTVMADAKSGVAKGKEVQTSLGAAATTETSVHLERTWDEGELLRVVGGQADEDDEDLAAAAGDLDLKGKVKQEQAGSRGQKDDAPKRRPGRPSKAAAAGSASVSTNAPKKSARGKGRAAVEVD